MRGLRVFLFINMLFLALYGLALIFMPGQMADAKMGPQDALSSRYTGATLVAVALAASYAFRDPKKNAAIIITLIVGDILNALVGLHSGITGQAEWSNALFSFIVGGVLAILLILSYPKENKAA